MQGTSFDWNVDRWHTFGFLPLHVQTFGAVEQAMRAASGFDLVFDGPTHQHRPPSRGLPLMVCEGCEEEFTFSNTCSQPGGVALGPAPVFVSRLLTRDHRTCVALSSE